MRYVLIVSTLLNLLVGIAFGAGYFLANEDMSFMAQYAQMPSEDRELLREKALPMIKSTPNATEEKLKDFFTDEKYQEIARGVGTPEELVRETARIIRRSIESFQRRQQNNSSAIELMKMRAGDYDQERINLQESEENLSLQRQQFQEERDMWAKMRADEALTRHILALDAAEKPEEVVDTILAGRAIEEQLFLLQSMKDPRKSALFRAALPADQQEALKRAETSYQDTKVDFGDEAAGS